MFIDNLPHPASVGPGGYTFKKQCRRPAGQRTVHDVAMARDPADIGGAEMNRSPFANGCLVLEHVLERIGGKHHIAATGMHHTFWLARTARRVENEQHIFGVHFLGGAFGGNLL